MARVVVIGGGIAGLATAEALSAQGHTVTVLDGRDRVGGVVRHAEVAGIRLDVGAESVRPGPEVDELLAVAGLSDATVSPEPVPAQLWSRGAVVPLPARTFMGVPSDPSTTGQVLLDDERARAGEGGDPHLGGDDEDADVSVTDGIAAEFGRGVVDRLVEPLLGGVYAGRVDDLSLASTMPPLWAAARREGSLRAAVASLVPPAPTGATGASAASGRRGPALLGLDGGISRLPEALGELLRLRGVDIRTETLVRSVERTTTGWRVVTGPTTDPVPLDADAVVVATNAPAAARLLSPLSPVAGAALGEVETASMAVITLAVPRGRDGWDDLPGSGFLVPSVDGRTIKASTFSSTKWGWAGRAAEAQGLLLLRASIGRAGEVAALQRDDAELTTAALADIATALGRPLPSVVDSHVQRWGGGLPQYTVGHRARVARVRAAVAGLPGLEVAGATYDGVGISSVVAGARTAARSLVHQLGPTKETA